jgi:hypothetical protein
LSCDGIFPKRSWHDAFDILKAGLKRHDALSRAIVLLRRKSGAYQVPFPENYTGDFERL